MLKRILTTGLILAGASAQAQNLSFDTSVSIEMVSATFKPAEAYSVATQTQFSVRNFELQADYRFDATYDTPIFSTLGSPRISMELLTVGFHGSYRVSNNVRAGAFATYMFKPSDFTSQSYTLGAEVMFSFGHTDIEAAVALEFPLNISEPTQSGNLFFAAYHSVNPQLELSLESSAYVNEISPDARIILASANAKYTLPNLPLSLKAGVQNAYFRWRAPLTSVRFSISYDFGAPSEFRAFGQRGLDYVELLAAARS
ncbi:MAG: hypothetical protein GQ535_11700 [Rhodobacteraceae bacterium]|nr:hypothetical protein [Paracoccaceae bacterium]